MDFKNHPMEWERLDAFGTFDWANLLHLRYFFGYLE